jgi:hypothetical protein
MSQISHVTKDAQGSKYLELCIPVIDRYGAVENSIEHEGDTAVYDSNRLSAADMST